MAVNSDAAKRLKNAIKEIAGIYDHASKDEKAALGRTLAALGEELARVAGLDPAASYATLASKAKQITGELNGISGFVEGLTAELKKATKVLDALNAVLKLFG